MSKAVKTVVAVVAGAALMIFAAPVAFLLIANTGLAAIGSAALFTGMTMLVTAVGVSIIGSAFIVEPPDQESAESYAGSKLATIMNNTSAVPVLFGENKVGSAIVFQDSGTYPPLLGDGATEGYNRHYWAIHIIGEGEVDSFKEVWADKEEMMLSTVGGTPATPAYDSEFGCEVGNYVLGEYGRTMNVSTYTTSGADGIAISDVQWTAYVNYGVALVPYNTKIKGSFLSGTTSTQYDNVRIPPNVAYMTVHQVYYKVDNKHTALTPVQPVVKGMPLRPTNSLGFGAAAYSDNPADQVAHLLTDGLSIPDGDIDFASFYVARSRCIDYGYTSNIVFNQRRNIQSEIRDILATCRGQVSYSQGKWIMHVDTKDEVVVKTLTADDILRGSLSISMVDFGSLANKITTKYINPADEWLSAEVYTEDNTLDLIDGQELGINIDIKGVTNSVQATKIGQIALNTMRYSEDANGDRLQQTPLMVTFGTTVRHADLEVGDVIAIDHDLLQRTRKFILTGMKTDQSGAMEVSAREYCDTHYVDSNGNDII